jgi:hypothetical protein
MDPVIVMITVRFHFHERMTSILGCSAVDRPAHQSIGDRAFPVNGWCPRLEQFAGLHHLIPCLSIFRAYLKIRLFSISIADVVYIAIDCQLAVIQPCA